MCLGACGATVGVSTPYHVHRVKQCYYELLGVEQTAAVSNIKRAYRAYLTGLLFLSDIFKHYTSHAHTHTHTHTLSRSPNVLQYQLFMRRLTVVE